MMMARMAHYFHGYVYRYAHRASVRSDQFACKELLMTINSFMTEVPIIQKPVSMNWFLYDRDLRHE